MVDAVVFSKKSDEWSTDPPFYQIVDRQFEFSLDPASTDENALCEMHYTQKEDGLKMPWYPAAVTYCNPPYSQASKWIAKASVEAAKGSTVVMLLAARTDTKAFHDYICQKKGVFIWYIRGRLKFGGHTNSAPFPSMVVVFAGKMLDAEDRLRWVQLDWDTRMKGKGGA